jgi:RNA polymerase sigma-70 factor (ECF subfamily)
VAEANARSAPAGDEADLVSRAKRSDRAAWAEIYSSHERFIYRYVRARVFEEAAAEDLTAAVFLAALQSIGSYHDRGRPLLAWLYRIARNTVADYQRKLAVDGRVHERLLPERWSEPATGPDTAERIERLDLRRAVADLPDTQREVIILRHFVGLSTPEIAAAIHKRPGAVYSLEARALASLRAELADLGRLSAVTDESGPRHAINKQME